VTGAAPEADKTHAPAPAEQTPGTPSRDEAPGSQAEAEPGPAAEHIEPDQATHDRVLQEELDKGTDRRVAEGRAKAAAIRAARQQRSGGAG
jgi:hypothetical protein